VKGGVMFDVKTIHWDTNFIGIKIKPNKKAENYIIKNLHQKSKDVYVSNGIYATLGDEIVIFIRHAIFDEVFNELC
jgi:hypothetical protein